MKGTLSITILLVLLSGSLYASAKSLTSPKNQSINSGINSNMMSSGTVHKLYQPYPSSGNNNKLNRDEIITYQEIFENGNDGWSFADGTIPPNLFHNYNSPTDGWVWWMGDPALATGSNIGRYHEKQYLVLDTPAIQVSSSNALLTFTLNYNVESPVGATTPYDGWDACNIRISTDGGSIWSILVGTPAYNVLSAYSFGYEHREGTNIPGWGGTSNGWLNASFDLGAYVGQDVIIRFAFASDDFPETSDVSSMFGMMVDDIHLGSFTNDSSSSIGFTASSLVPVGGQLWHIAEVADAPSPTHAMICQNDAGSYNPSMLNYLVSPSIQLPEFGDIKADFQIKGSFSNFGTIPDINNWSWEISPDNGTNWYSMMNPYHDPVNIDWITDAPSTWRSVTEAYISYFDGLISDYSGLMVKFRIFFETNTNVHGTGIMIDNFTITNILRIPPPVNLSATLSNSNVHLNWMAPNPAILLHFLTSTNENWSDYVSSADAYAMKIDNPGSTPTQLHGINFMLYRQNSMPIVCTPSIHVWANEAGFPGTELIVIHGITEIDNYAWKNVDVTNSNIMIPSDGSIFVGISDINPGDVNAQGLLCDATSPISNSFVNIGGEWGSLGIIYSGLVNCGLSATIYDADPTAPVLTGYKVFHSLDPVGTFTEIADIIDTTTHTYTDQFPAVGIMNYYKVTGVYGINQSYPSSIASIFVFGADYSEILYDDNEADQGYNAGSTHSMVVKFDPDIPYGVSCEIAYAKVFVNTVGIGSLIIRVYNANGINSTPGAELLLFSYPHTSLVQGWNIIPMLLYAPETTGSFYIGILDYAGSSAVGLDTDSHNRSWKNLSSTGPWQQITEGNLMIRAIIRSPVGNDDLVEIAPEASLYNYPNPFNLETTIKYNQHNTGTVKIAIYNIKGQMIKELKNGYENTGVYSLTWDGTDSQNNAGPSGIYFIRMVFDGKTMTRKIMLVK